MNDQVTLSEPRILVQPLGKRTSHTGTQILSITNGYGEPIEPGGISTNGDLSFVGAASPDQQAQILDRGVPAHIPVNVDEAGHFSAFLPGQRYGDHEFSVRTTDGQESALWPVFVDVHEEASIEWIAGPDGELIYNGATTLHNELSFVGQGIADQSVDLLDNGVILQTLNVDEGRHWSALVKDLSTGSHNFTVRGRQGEESSPWRVLIKKPAPLSIQFVIGKGSFQLIGNHESTVDRTVTLVGTANPGETGGIVDYHNELVPFAADQNGVYTATIEGLEENRVHTFRLKSDMGRLSTPWAIRVIASQAV